MNEVKWRLFQCCEGSSCVWSSINPIMWKGHIRNGKALVPQIGLNFTRYVDFELEIALQWPFCDSNPCHELLPRSSILHRTFVMTQNLFFGFYLVESLCEWKNSSSASWVWIKLNGDHNFDIELYQLVITVLFSATLTMPRIVYSNFCCDLLPRHDFSHDR